MNARRGRSTRAAATRARRHRWTACGPAQLDVCDDASIEALPAAVGDRVDALWNVGGVLHEGDRGPERSLDAVDRSGC